MKYVDFIERVRRSLVVYESTLASYFEGGISKEDAEKILDATRSDIARHIESYERSGDDCHDLGRLCPQCNIIKAKTADSPRLAVYPARVGQLMHHTSDIYQDSEWLECPVCGYQCSTKKIEHWE